MADTSDVVGESREVIWRPAYHRCAKEPSKNFGICSPRMVWVLRKGDRAVTWEVFTGWTMPDEAFHLACPECEHPMHQRGMPPSKPMGGAVDWHSPTPWFDHQEQPDHQDCMWTGGICYSDVGFILGDELFAILRVRGDEAVWAAMSELLVNLDLPDDVMVTR